MQVVLISNLPQSVNIRKIEGRSKKNGCHIFSGTFYPQALIKLFQSLAAILKISRCMKRGFH